jgi:tRNA-specific 2-thiouridylase
MQRVFVALSGGVDSSTAAGLLVQQGYQVDGVTMRLWNADTEQRGNRIPNSHRSASDPVEDARRVCARLAIPFHVVDLEEQFRVRVVDYFCDSYALGRTPNPCLACNREIKFGALLRIVRDRGADYLATGHYARIRPPDGQHPPRTERGAGAKGSQPPKTDRAYQLLRGADRQKDQSYVLYRLGQDELPRLLFPLGEYSKPQVRAMAARLGLPTANKPESQDACFLSHGDYRAFLAQKRPEAMQLGPILDVQGRVLGEHRGVAFYTVGQRQGMGLTAAHPLYVVEIDSARNALIVGPKAALVRRELLAEEVHFVAGTPPLQPISITAKIRYKAEEAAATVFPLPGQKARVVFVAPQPAITPGQGVVFYQDEVVVGGGIITSTMPMEV